MLLSKAQKTPVVENNAYLLKGVADVGFALRLGEVLAPELG